MLVLLLSFVILLLLGLPLFFVLGISSLIYLIYDGTSLVVVAQKMISGIDSFSLLAVPFFILAGDLMYEGKLSEKLVGAANSLIGHLRGGLSSVTVVSAMFFAAISGSAPATTASVGTIMIPEMEKKGYSRSFSAALATASGPIGQIIPPSIPMIIYAVLANVSITKLFFAGIIPGILMGLSLMIVSYIYVRMNDVESKTKRSSFKEILSTLNRAKWALLAPIIILGGIYGGIFTPTEASVVAVVYGLLTSLLIYRSIKIKDLPKIFIKSANTSTMVISIIAVASLFGWIMARSGVAQELSKTILSLSDNPIIILILINVLLLIIGALMDNIAAIIILLPVLLPISDHLGMDPIHFGAMVVINFAIGMATPPIGYSLFVGASVSGLKVEQISKSLLPLLLAMLIVLMLVAYVPALTTWLPGLVD